MDKHPINVISDILRKKLIRFTVEGNEEYRDYYIIDFPIGSAVGYIQVELGHDDMIYIQVYYDLNDCYTQELEIKGVDNITEEIFGTFLDEFIDTVKHQMRIVWKISNKVNEIIELAEEAGMDYEDFITVNFDMN